MVASCGIFQIPVFDILQEEDPQELNQICNPVHASQILQNHIANTWKENNHQIYSSKKVWAQFRVYNEHAFQIRKHRYRLIVTFRLS